MMQRIKISTEKGFTLIELMIATTVFSVILLLCTYGLLAVGRSYYKGVTISRTQETARLIVDDVVESIQFNGGAIMLNPGGRVYCIGSRRYSFALNEVKSNANRYVLIADNVGACTGGTTRNGEVDGNSPLTAATDPSDLLNTRMRLARFEIVRVNDSIYRVRVRILSGENDMMETVSGEVVCRNERTASQFCAAADISTVVHKRV